MSKKAKKVLRIGIVGMGTQGSLYTKYLLERKVQRAKLAAVCDLDPKTLEQVPASVARYKSYSAMLKSGEIDAVFVETPHYDHVPMAIKALRAGLHVLVDKPMAVQKSECEKLVKEAKKHKKQVFAMMFNQRTNPAYQKLKKMIAAGELGEIVRVNWIITNWFRSEAYYKSGGWRATWAGEGGGVLVNQCPHQLDLLQWIAGMPVKVDAACALGKGHKIEVEDEVTAYLEYKNGATGVFITSTCESPGTNRLEIAGDKAMAVIEGGIIKVWTNEMPVSKFNRVTKTKFGSPKRKYKEITFKKGGGGHVGIMRNFVAAVLDGKELLAPGADGINGVELANAMQLSGITGQTVDLPIRNAAYNRMLKELIKQSESRKKRAKAKRRKK